jgi:hypothetical protein
MTTAEEVREEPIPDPVPPFTSVCASCVLISTAEEDKAEPAAAAALSLDTVLLVAALALLLLRAVNAVRFVREANEEREVVKAAKSAKPASVGKGRVESAGRAGRLCSEDKT